MSAADPVDSAQQARSRDIADFVDAGFTKEAAPLIANVIPDGGYDLFEETPDADA